MKPDTDFQLYFAPEADEIGLNLMAYKSGSDDGYFYALNTGTGRPAWRYATGEVRSSASLASGHLYVGSLDGTMYAFS